MKKIIFAISFFSLSWAALPLSAEVMTYQGRLKESNFPVNANRVFIFKFCDAESFGNCDTTPSGFQSFTVQNGLFKSTFAVPTSDLSQGAWYLQVSVGVDAPSIQDLSPRERLTAVPYSVYSSTAGYSPAALQKAGDTMTGQLTSISSVTITGNGGVYGLQVSSNVSLAGALYSANGNIGIGTTAPQYPLVVLGNSAGNIINAGNAANPGGDTAGFGLDTFAAYPGAALYVNNAKVFNVESNGGAIIGSTYMTADAVRNGLIVQGQVGIGTALPNYALEISSGGGEAGTIMSVSTGATNLFWVAGDGAHSMKFTGDGSGLTGVTGAAGTDSSKLPLTGGTLAGQLTLAGSTLTVTGDAFSVGGSTFAVSAGRVGIGTATPATVLHIKGDVNNVNPVLALESYPSGATRSEINFKVPSGNAGFIAVNGDADSIRIGTNTAIGGPIVTLVTIKPSGNVGIGTTNPGAMLDVAGTGNFSGSVTASSSGTFKAAGGNQFSVETSSGILVQGGRIQAPAIQLTNGAAANYVLASDAAGNANWVNPASGGVGDGLVGNEITDAANMSLTRSGAGTVADPYMLALNLSNANNWTAAQTFNAGLTGSLSGAASQNILKAGDTMSGQLTLAGSTLTVTGDAFSVGGSTLVVTNGYLGLGTNAPAARLHVVSDNGSLHFVSPNSQLIMNMIPQTYSPAVLNNNASGPVALSIDNDPKVYVTPQTLIGIGTLSPSYRLHVSSGAGETGIIMAVSTGTSNIFSVDGSGVNALKFTGDGSGLTGVTGASGTDSTRVLKTGDTMSGQLTNTSSVTITGNGGAYGLQVSSNVALAGALYSANGNVGIGGVAPGAKLDVYGPDTASFIEVHNTTNSGKKTLRVGLWSSHGLLDVYNTGEGTAVRLNADPTAPSFFNAGNVGIGTTAPDQKLTVAGDISQTGVLISSGTGRNYFAGEVTAARYQIGGSTVLAVLPGISSLGVGLDAGTANYGDGNLFVGIGAGKVNDSGINNSFLGSEAGYNNTTGMSNLFIGYYAGRSNNFGGNNSFAGSQSGFNNTGNSNSFFGADSGMNNNSGSYNVFIGAKAGYNSDGTGNIVIGYNKDTSAPAAAYELNIGGVLYGDLTAKTIGISTRVPQAALDIVSTGTVQTQFAQIWRDSNGNIQSSMSATGVMMATKFVGNGSGLTGVSATDATKLPLAGGSMSGQLTLAGSTLTVISAGSPVNSGVLWASTSTVTPALFVSTTGLVGLGTASPGYPLHVIARSGQVGIRLDGYDASNDSIYIDSKNGGKPMYGYVRGGGLRAYTEVDTSNRFNITVNSQDRLTITPQGFVGINDLSPAYLLQVSTPAGEAGTIMAVSTGTTDVFWVAGDGAHATSFYGDGTGLTGVAATDATKLPLAGGTMTGDITMGANDLYAVSTITATGDITAARYQINGNTMVAVLPGSDSIAYGVGAGASNITGGNYNVFIGNNAGASNTTGGQNAANGFYALYANTTGSANTANGSSALQSNTTGGYNTANGYYALRNNTTGETNTANGSYALYNTNTGSANTSTGYRAGYGVPSNSFSSSTLMGYQAGYGLSTGSDNILLGFRAGYNVTTGTGNIVIGYGKDTSAPGASNELNIGGVLYGDLSAKTIGISTRVPQAALDIVSTGTVQTQFAQIWRDSNGVIKSSMSATGVLMAGKFVGDGSGLTSVAANDATKLPLTGGTLTGQLTNTSSVTITGNGGGAYGLEVSSNVSLAGALYSANGNVGIGGAAPGAKLDVYSFNTTSFLEVHNASIGSKKSFRVFQSNNHGLLDVFDTAETIAIRLNAENTSPSYINAGKVGIGTTVPATLLHVGAGTPLYGGVVGGDVSMLTIRTAGHNFVLVENQAVGMDAGIVLSPYLTTGGDAAIFVDEDDNQKLKFAMGTVDSDAQRNSVTRMTIDQSGKVGIGTAAPSYLLQISSGAGETGTIMAVSTGATNVFWAAGDGAHATTFWGDGSGLTGVNVADGVYTTAANTFTNPFAPVLIKPSGVPGADTKLFDMQATGAGVTNFSVDSEGDVTTTGGMLVLKTDTASTSKLTLETNNNPNNILELAKYGSTAGGSVAGGTILLANLSRVAAGATGGPLMLQVVTNNPMYFVTNDSERMRIAVGGNVGIATASPAGLFQVGGGSLTVMASGNVGIGTTAPGYSLHVKPAAGTSVIAIESVAGSQPQLHLVANDTQNPTLGFGINGTAGYVGSIYGNGADASLRFTTNLTDRVTISSAGNVGISTGVPQARLDVLAAGSAQTDMAQIWRNLSGTIVSSVSATGVLMASKFVGDGSGLTNIPAAENSFTPLTLNSSSFTVRTGNTIHFAADTTGKVGINSFPDTTSGLQLTGTGIYDSGIKLVNSGATWAIHNNVGVLSFTKTSGATFGVLTLNNTGRVDVPVGGFYVGASTLVVVNAKVGIGTTAPSRKLEVNGEITASHYEIGGSTVVAILTGLESLGIGVNAGRVNTGGYNVFVGSGAGYNNTSGVNNSFLGRSAGINNTTGGENSFLGSSAGYSNTAGTGNTFLGFSAGTYNTTGEYNSTVGNFAGVYNKAGSANAILGSQAGYGLPTNSFSSSTIMGYKAGYSLSNGSADNIFVGFQAGYNVTTGTGNIVIGYGKDTTVPGANNELNIGGVIFGNLAAGYVGVGAGVTNPGGALQVGLNGLIISTGGAIQTTGFGHGTTAGSARGVGAVDLQTNRNQASRVASGAYATITGGESNRAAGDYSAVSGKDNEAMSLGAAVSGGWQNVANNSYASVSGGISNTASGFASSVSGGRANTASGDSSFVGGGGMDGVGGGGANLAQGKWSAVVGGNNNTASQIGAAVVGGEYNVAKGMNSFIGGGGINEAKGWGAVAFGANNASMGDYTFAAGKAATSAVNGTFTWADSSSEGAVNNVLDQVMFKAKGGFWVSTGSIYGNPAFYVDASNNIGIGTLNPASKLTVLDGDIRISTTAGSRGIIFQDGSTQLIAAGSSQWTVSGSDIYNLNAGNVGVGTVSPLVKFHNNGPAILASNISIDPDTYANSVIAGYVSDGGLNITGIGGMATNAGSTWGIGHNNADLVFAVGDGTNPNTLQTFMQATWKRNLALVPVTGSVGVGLAAATVPDQKLTVIGNISQTGVLISSGGGNNYFAGNVGIGTNTPVAMLDVNGTARLGRHVVESRDTGGTMSADHFGKTITVNSASPQAIMLPVGTAGAIGAQFTFVKLGAGKVTIQAGATDFIADSSMAGGIYNDAASPAYATITLRLVTSNQWMLVGGEGAWVTQ